MKQLLPRSARSRFAGPWFQFDDPVGFQWNVYDLPIANLPAELDGFRIVQISDLHCKPTWKSAYDDLLDRLRGDEPDLLVLTGDLTDDIADPEKCLPIARRLIGQMRARSGVLGVLGNHDLFVSPDDYNGTPLRLVDGQRLLLRRGAARLEVIGVPGPERCDCPPQFHRTLPPNTPGVPRVVLSHFPDHIRKLKFVDPDVFLAGHTHGGQICLPGGIPILRHDSLPINYFAGVHRYGSTWFVVSRGFGFSSAPYRLFCPSEVVELRLRPALHG